MCPSQQRAIAHKGYDVFYTEPNTKQEIKCKVCAAICCVNRNAKGSTGFLSAISGNHTLHDKFYCPNTGRDWHIIALALTQEVEKTASKSIANLIKLELRKLIDKNKKSQKRYKKYIDNQWQDTDCLEKGYYIFKNKDGVAYCKEKAPYDGNGNPFLNRSLNDAKFEVEGLS